MTEMRSERFRKVEAISQRIQVVSPSGDDTKLQKQQGNRDLYWMTELKSSQQPQ